MERADVVDLITEHKSAHGVHEAISEEARRVFCTVRSVTRSEYYTALNVGVMPRYVFHLTLAEDYEDERYIRYQGKKYRVVRTYMTEDDGIDITVERADENDDE